MTTHSKLYIGLMSGTSADAIDAALVDFSQPKLQLLAHYSHPLGNKIKNKIFDLFHPGEGEVDRLGQLENELGHSFAAAVKGLLNKSHYTPKDIIAIGSHGQTVRHRPEKNRQINRPFTLQIGDPNVIAEITGICTVADFRRRDMACGGQGAPLAPGFHNSEFSSPNEDRCILNIGGMANLTYLPSSIATGSDAQIIQTANVDTQSIAENGVTGFDTGPGNTLMDAWVKRHLKLPYDTQGNWARSGKLLPELLQKLLAHPFFTQAPPKSCGPESFNLAWLEREAGDSLQTLDPTNVQTTLAELSAISIANALKTHCTKHSKLYVCGGGSHNDYLLQRLRTHLPNTLVDTTDALGVSPDWVEALAFAWLAKRGIERLSGNVPAVTGATKAVVLGGIYPA